MTYYEKLKIPKYFGKNLKITLRNGSVIHGVLDLDCINEDWEEDGEKEAIGIDIGMDYTKSVDLDTIRSIDIADLEITDSIVITKQVA